LKTAIRDYKVSSKEDPSVEEMDFKLDHAKIVEWDNKLTKMIMKSETKGTSIVCNVLQLTSLINIFHKLHNLISTIIKHNPTHVNKEMKISEIIITQLRT